MTAARRRAVTAAAVLAVAGAAAGAGCGRDDGDSQEAQTRTQTIERTTRVEVLRRAGDGRGVDFDPRAIYEREGPGVVTVISTGLRGLTGRDNGGLGSGFVISGDGEVATNAHVVTSGEGKEIAKAKAVYVRFADGNQVSAKIVGFDPFSDVALLEVDPDGLRLRPLPMGSARRVRVGEPVAAIGSPFGEEQSLSVGVVSATGRSIESLTGFLTSGAIQTDAAINHGNSGGPLIDARGEVLGINSQIRTDSGDGTGVGFAVPIDVVRRSLDQIRRSGRARYAYLGVTTSAVYPQLAERFDLPVREGAWIQEVVDDGPADDGGLRAGERRQRFQEQQWVVGGDIVTRVERHRVRENADLGEIMLRYRPGQTIELEVWRGEERRTLRVKLGERPLETPRS